jgi:DNA-binding FadR family transcriptional regulator
MGHLGARDHGALVDALRKREVAAVEGIMRSHLERTASRIASAREDRAGR